MNNVRATLPPYFCPDGYRAILERALASGYDVTNFKAFRPPAEKPVLLLRHDLDHSIRSAAFVAEMEAEQSVAATYFVQVACDFYNLLSAESRRLLRHIVSLGHEVGLHYDASRYLGERGEDHLHCDLALLADMVGERIVSASQHIPIASPQVHIADFIENEAYEPRFTQAPMTYISDSLMAWRQATPHDLLDQRCSFQLLTHPMKWAHPFTSMNDALRYALNEECQTLRERYEKVTEQYDALLMNRTRLDAEWQARRGHA